jgi:hypothetical protein
MANLIGSEDISVASSSGFMSSPASKLQCNNKAIRKRTLINGAITPKKGPSELCFSSHTRAIPSHLSNDIFEHYKDQKTRLFSPQENTNPREYFRA